MIVALQGDHDTHQGWYLHLCANPDAVLLGRARRCEKLRNRPRTLVAVNFVEEGDLFTVVDELTGVATAASAPLGG